jgi:DMSO/TMAO reductase YedYZ heme-binding membrane subunit
VTTWIILRAAGVGAYLMLFASVAFGLVATTAPFGKRIAKQSAILIHQFLSTVGLVLLVIHVGGLLVDSFMHFAPRDVLVPGASTYRPIPVALGIIAMYAMVMVLVSSWVRRHYSSKLWRRLHLAAAPTFALAMLHGVFAGSDATRRWMFLTYVITGSIVVFLLLLRGLQGGRTPVRRAQSSPEGSPRASRSMSPPSVPVGEAPPAPATDAAGVSGRLAAGVSSARDDTGSGARAGTETRIGATGSVSRVPAMASEPTTSTEASAIPASPHPSTVTVRRNMEAR